MAVYEGQGEAQALAGSDQNRSVCSTISSERVRELYGEKRSVDVILDLAKSYGETFSGVDNTEKWLEVFHENYIVTKKFGCFSNAYPLSIYDGPERLWIVSDSEKLKKRVRGQMFRGKRFAILNDYMGDIVDLERNAIEDNVIRQRQLFDRVPFLLDTNVFGGIISCSLPGNMASLCTSGLLPVFDSKRSVVCVDNSDKCVAAVNGIGLPGTKASMFVSYLDLFETSEVVKPYPLNCALIHKRAVFEACNGYDLSVNLQLELDRIIDERSFVSWRRKIRLVNMQLVTQFEKIFNHFVVGEDSRELFLCNMLSTYSNIRFVEFLTTYDVHFEASSGSMCEYDLKSDRSNNRKRKIKTKLLPKRVVDLRNLEKQSKVFKKGLKMVPYQSRKEKVDKFESEYEDAFSKLSKLALGASFAESCSSTMYDLTTTWVEDAKAQFDKMYNTSKLVDRAVSFIEQMGLLVFTCKQAKNFAGIASAIALWLVTRFSGDKSVIMNGFKVLNDFLGAANIDSFASAFDDGVEETKMNEPNSASSCNGLEFDEISGAFSSARFLGQSETMVKLQEFVGILSNMGCVSIFGYKMISDNVSTTFSKFMYMTKFYDVVVGHVTYFIERCWAAYEERDPRALLGCDSTGDLMLRVQDLDSIVKTISSNTTMIDPVTIDKLEMDVEDCIRKLARSIQSSTGITKSQFMRSREKMLDVKIEMDKIRESGANVVPAMGILLCGVTGQGKSSVTDLIISGLLAQHHNEISECGYQTMQGSEKWDQAQPGFRACVLEELASTNPNKELSPESIARVLRFINPARTPAMSAEAEKKGSLLPKYSIVVASTNVKDFHAGQWLSHPHAALRRFKFYVTVRADPRFTENGILSASKVPDDVAPWLMTLQRYTTVINEEKTAPQTSYDHGAFASGVRGFFEVVTFEGVEMRDVPFNTAYRCISEAYGHHLAQEGSMNVKSTVYRQMGVCPHGIPYTHCEDLGCVYKKQERLKMGSYGQSNRNKVLDQKLKRYNTPYFNRKYAKAQSSAGEEGRSVFHLFDGSPTLEKLNRRIGRTGLETVSFQDIMKVSRTEDVEVTLELFNSARELQKWHVVNKCEQGNKFFSSSHDVQHSLLRKWRSLRGTVFKGIRAPYRTGDFPRSDYVLSTDDYGDIYHTADEKAYNDDKKTFELSESNAGFMAWKRSNRLLAPIVDFVLARFGFAVNKDSVFLNGLSSVMRSLDSCVNPYMTLFMLIISGLFIPWTLMFLLPLSVLYGICMMVNLVLEKLLFYWDNFNPEYAGRMLLIKAKDYVKSKYAKVGAAVCLSLVAGKVAYNLYCYEDKPKHESCGSEFSKPKEIKPGFKDIYQRPVVHDIRQYTPLGPNNTLEQAISVLSNSLYVMRMSTPGTRLADKLGVTFSNCILTGMFAIANKHSFVGLGNEDPYEQIEVQIYQSKNMQPHCTTFIIKDDLEFFGDDFVLIRLMNIVPAFDLFKSSNSLFPERKVDIPVHSTWICRDLDGNLRKELVQAVPAKVVYEDRRNSQMYGYDGYLFSLSEAKKGQCMAMLISHTNPFVVVGVHTAGHVGYKEAMAGRITRMEVVEAMAKYNARHVMCTAAVGDVEVDPFKTKLYELRPLTKEACVNYVPNDIGVSNCQVYGQIPGLVNQRQATDKVKYTSIGKKMEKLHPEFEVDLPINLHPRGFQQNLVKCAVQTSCGRRKALEWAENSLFDHYSNCIDKLDEIGETNFSRDVHPIPVESVFNGAVAGYNTVDLTKSAGYGLRGKKRAYMEEPVKFEEFDDYVLPKQELRDAVDEMFEKCRNGEIPSSIHTGSLKRELLPKSKCTVPKPFEIVYDESEVLEGKVHIDELMKKKVRFFAGCSFPFLICCKMMFGMLLRYFTLHALVFGMALGLNLHSYDFTALVRSWNVFGEAIIAGDYEKFDKKLNAMVTNTSARVIIRLLKKADYSEELLKICSCLLYDVIFPLYLWAGVLIRFAQTTPSGHPLTLFKNNLDNQICMRYCWFRLFEDLGWDVPDFDEFVALNTVGDDHIGTVSPLYPQYNLQTIAKYMLELGMVYTAADKTELVNVYESFDEIEYLKMRAKWNDELGVYVPLLNKASIYKMITKTLANFSEGSVAMEEHTVEVLREAFHCMFYYGREEYNVFVREVVLCIEHDTFKYVSFSIPSYEDEVASYKERLRESNTVKLDTNFSIPKEWDLNN